jgi:lipoyl(octanoyl) transferase
MEMEQTTHYKPSTWRVIQDPPAHGAWNMAVDEAILESVYTGKSKPTLRLYAWQPACLSLGLAQPFAEVNTQALAERGWDVVRRPTGGRAILHVDELTYSVIAPEDEPRVTGGVLKSYLRLSQALLEALRLIGLCPEANEKDSNTNTEKPNPVCFEAPSNYEITVNKKKLIGSAQARRKEGVLQHGALPLHGDLTRVIDALRFTDEVAANTARARLLAHATTIERELGAAPSFDEIREAFINAFQKTLNLHLQPGKLTTTERQRAQSLMAEKYAHPSWTERIK